MLQATADSIRRLLRGRALAYNRVFDRQNVFTHEVLADLARFCRAHETTFSADPRLHAALEGRREVWLRIVNHLNLSHDELFQLHKIKQIEGD